MKTLTATAIGLALTGVLGCNSITYCNDTLSGIEFCSEDVYGTACPTGSTPTAPCPVAHQIGSCSASPDGYGRAAFFYSTGGVTALQAQLVCAGTLLGSWTASGSLTNPIDVATVATGKGACDVKTTLGEVCMVSPAVSGAVLCSEFINGTAAVVSTCSRANALGTCTAFEADAPVTAVYYSGGYTAASAQSNCPATWTPN